MAIGNQSKIRLDIQGLRAISVLFVLLFHLWRREFPCGHLGVDIFFCISGYLMFSVLFKLGLINLSKIFEFYFRRLRRIVPTYLFVIFVVLILIYSLLPPTEFKDVVTNAIPSLFFVSNIFKIQRDSYFDLRSQYRFFLHTWSLSCELQFYSIAPLLFLVIKLGSKAKPMIGGFIICLFLLGSFLYQTLYSSEHTDLVGRLW
ncbi:O-antigen acetylase [Aphelenchoides bicaudatus]|nr:O-antigen acetylase [Aphelenchoides bicaudatus]